MELKIRMLGEFSVSYGDKTVSDKDNRSKKVWALISYLICRRGRPATQRELIDLLWGDDPSSSNPENALKITLHRARGLLNNLYPEAGHQLIQRKDAGYVWNCDVPAEIDADRFSELCALRDGGEEKCLEAWLEAFGIYKGDFLEKLSSEMWVIPMAAHIHNLYIQTVMDAVPLLSARGRHAEAAAICRTACAMDRYHEPLHSLLISELAASGDQEGAAAVYKDLSQRLFDDFGIRPGSDTREAYRAATQTLNDQSLPMDVVLEHLRESDASDGAMYCDYDYFKILCHSEARNMARSGKVIHIALFSVSGFGKPLSTRGRNTAMEQLGEQIRTSLRRGDTYSRCSTSQYIVMLPLANYENSCMVCRRVTAAFTRKHPRSTAKISFVVQPLGQNDLDF